MKKIFLPALATVAALGLAACDSTAEAPAEAEGDAVVAEDVGTDPAMTEPVVDEDGDSISISEDGVSADINDGDTSVSADIGDNPSMTVETD